MIIKYLESMYLIKTTEINSTTLKQMKLTLI